MLGAGENEHLLPVVVADQTGQQFPFARFLHRVNQLLHSLNRIVASANLDRRRILQQTIRQLLDRIGKRGRKQQRLLLLRQQRQHLADITDKTHVEHAVRLVEYQDFNAR